MLTPGASSDERASASHGAPRMINSSPFENTCYRFFVSDPIPFTSSIHVGIEHGPRIFHQPTCHHAPELYPGIAEGAAGELLRDFFSKRR